MPTLPTFIKPPRVVRKKGERELNFWKRTLIERTLYAFFIVGTIIVIPSAWGGFYVGEYIVGVFDIVVYSILLFLYFNPRLSTKTKANGSIFLFGLTGLTMTVVLGPIGAGFIWLFAFTTFCTLFYGNRGNAISIGVLSIILTVLGFLLSTGVFEGTNFGMYGLLSFSLTGINFLAIAFLLNLAFSYLINRLEENLIKQIKTSEKFKAKSEALEKTNQQLDRLVYSVSHDIRAPLANIIGLSNVADQESNPEEVGKYLHSIKNSAEKLQEFTEKIIAFFKSEHKEAEMELIPVKSFLMSLLQNHFFNSLPPDASIDLKVPETMFIFSDTTRLEIIFLNLITNSVKYADSSRPLKVEIKVSESGTNYYLDVKDNGIGIPKSKIGQVFNLFVRATYKNPGAGLGLYIVKESVKSLGGEIHVRSVEGEYSRFSIRLPKEKV